MLDIRFIREHPDRVKEAAAQKGYDIDIDKLLVLEDERRKLNAHMDELRAARNANADAMKQAGKPDPAIIAEGKRLKTEIAEHEAAMTELDPAFLELWRSVPNVALDMVPIGRTEDDNIVAKTWGEKPIFNHMVKSHFEIAEAKDWIDKERAAKIAGARFAYLKGDLVRLEMALWNYGMDVLSSRETLRTIIDANGLDGVSDQPFTPIIPPAVARTDVFLATGRLNRQEQTYKLEDEDLWLNASAEHTMAPMYMNEILSEAQLPLRLVGYTTAFRREAGTYGKDAEGIFRLHQFNKLEMESFTTAKDGLNEHLFMVAIQEYLMERLGLPYQTIEKCTADIGRPNAKGVDLNVWLPGQDAYRETHTADYIGDYQARAMKTRVRTNEGVELAHTNDATVFSERPLVAIIENFQTPDGDVVIPEVLRPYMGGRGLI
ncbi:MAG TPA: serine--tRNA ligase [Candidatus Saccharimonadales bacterium]|jgi:seryl-tRNA synthetase